MRRGVDGTLSFSSMECIESVAELTRFELDSLLSDWVMVSIVLDFSMFFSFSISVSSLLVVL